MSNRSTTRSPLTLNFVVLLLFVLLSGCASLPENVSRPASYGYTDTEYTQLGQKFAAAHRKHPQESGFLLLSNGVDAFVARGFLMQTAERSIDAQYYLLHNDLTGRLFVDQLIQAADRGVRVRLLVDDMDFGGRTLGAAVLDNHPNMEVRLFNPFARNTGRLTQFVTRFGSVTRRMHNKSFTVDNQAGIIGGRNIGDEYFDANPDFAFTDLDVLVVGPVVKEVSNSFDQYWNNELSYPATRLLGRSPTDEEHDRLHAVLKTFMAEQKDSIYLQELRESELAEWLRTGTVPFEWGDAKVMQDTPDKILANRSEHFHHLAPQLAPYFKEVSDELYIFSPYFVPGKKGVAYLSDLSERGIRVRVVTNGLSSTDVPVVHSGYAKYRKALLKAGVELYEMKPDPNQPEDDRSSDFTGSSKASLHSKAFIFDQKYIFIGSLNLDPRSIKENTEIGVVLTAPELAMRIVPDINRAIEKIAFKLELKTLNDGRERITWLEQDTNKIHYVDPQTSFWQRFLVAVSGFLPIESQL
ncbi:MAG: phospholipase D family protein [Gammaproteobacteria bacterium]|nr:phospholipase D family protein [Gammaproteobacteria bacterium]